MGLLHGWYRTTLLPAWNTEARFVFPTPDEIRLGVAFTPANLFPKERVGCKTRACRIDIQRLICLTCTIRFDKPDLIGN